MERTFLLGVYPRVDDARLDYMVEALRCFMSGERAGAPGGALSAPPER